MSLLLKSVIWALVRTQTLVVILQDLSNDIKPGRGGEPDGEGGEWRGFCCYFILPSVFIAMQSPDLKDGSVSDWQQDQKKKKKIEKRRGELIQTWRNCYDGENIIGIGVHSLYQRVLFFRRGEIITSWSTTGDLFPSGVGNVSGRRTR